MASVIKQAVLGLVVREATHGYALTRHLRRWAAPDSDVSQSSVYAAVGRLEAEELIEQVPPVPGVRAERPARIAYRATAAGVSEFDAWMASEPASYDELRLRLALGRPADLDALLGHVVAAQEATLRALQEIPEPSFERILSGDGAWTDFESAILGTFEASEFAARAQALHRTRTMLARLQAEQPDRWRSP